MVGSCTLANALESGSVSLVEKSFTVTSTYESKEPEQNRVGGNLIFSPPLIRLLISHPCHLHLLYLAIIYLYCSRIIYLDSRVKLGYVRRDGRFQGLISEIGYQLEKKEDLF